MSEHAGRMMAFSGWSLAISIPPVSAAEEPNLYLHRQHELISPFIEAFEADTGVTTAFVEDRVGIATSPEFVAKAQTIVNRVGW